jgi:hypothetical protein
MKVDSLEKLGIDENESSRWQKEGKKAKLGDLTLILQDLSRPKVFGKFGPETKPPDDG